MMMIRTTPADAYRRVTIDARIKGSGSGDLALLCFEQVVSQLARALRAHAADDRAARSDGLTRANAALMALEMGLDRASPLASALLQTYDAAREIILDSVIAFDSAALAQVRADFAEIGEALAAASSRAELTPA